MTQKYNKFKCNILILIFKIKIYIFYLFQCFNFGDRGAHNKFSSLPSTSLMLLSFNILPSTTKHFSIKAAVKGCREVLLLDQGWIRKW
jgi:hypothetical protein